jgi:hypothetical protein
MDKEDLSAFRGSLENELGALLLRTLQQIEKQPQMIQGTMLVHTAGTFGDKIKNSYFDFKKEYSDMGEDFGLSEGEYKSIIDDVVRKVLSKFVKL